ncbi:hypothetical protein HPB52_021140 [Rhipicephalus sanguineus]|uniref:Uncharacterized protein n=1 Tax=Rhipicephalus sanguineus TaxID=34632 RepID=A0A9D4SV64_RHISA|nr:hypothetical protein HPB52_021140 [Rhipicephalus sanguineus]
MGAKEEVRFTPHRGLGVYLARRRWHIADRKGLTQQVKSHGAEKPRQCHKWILERSAGEEGSVECAVLVVSAVNFREPAERAQDACFLCCVADLGLRWVAVRCEEAPELQVGDRRCPVGAAVPREAGTPSLPGR